MNTRTENRNEAFTHRGWTDSGHRNLAIYKPGTPCDAYGGSPTFSDDWAVVTWWPGSPTCITHDPSLEVIVACIQGSFRDTSPDPPKTS